jgi:hypothetical protein
MNLSCHLIPNLIPQKPKEKLPNMLKAPVLFQHPKAHTEPPWHTSYLGCFLNKIQIGKKA